MATWSFEEEKATPDWAKEIFADLIPKPKAGFFDHLIPDWAQPPEQSSQVGDIAKSLGIGLVKGAINLADIPYWLDLGAGKLNEFLVSKGLVEPTQQETFFKEPVSPRIQSAIEQKTGEFYKPQTIGGEYAQTIGEFAPGMMLGPGGIARSALTAIPKAVTPGVVSESAGRVAKHVAPEYEGAARLGGALLGGYAGARALTPAPARPERAAQAAVLQAEGIPMTAGQRTGNRPLQWFEAAAADTPFAAGPAARINEAQSRAFTGAALKRMGASGDEIATPEVLRRETGRISQTFEDLSTRNAITPDRRLNTDLLAARRDYERVVGANRRAPIVDETLQDIVGAVRQNSGVIPGEWYQSTRSSLDRTARGLRQADPQLSRALFDIRYNAMGRSISPADRAAWQQARGQWKNWKAIEKATTGAGSATAEGFISPSQLRTAVAGQNRGAYARGRGDLAELSRAGEAVLKPLPSSGTAQRTAAGNAFASLGGIIAGGAAGGAPGAVLGAAAPWVAGRTLLSKPVQRYLGNQIAPSTRDERLLNALLAAYTTDAIPHISQLEAFR